MRHNWTHHNTFFDNLEYSNMGLEFRPFPKVPRLNRDCVITEKLDGTNAQITITEDGQFLCGSRNRWITPENDNYGFARWAHENREELMGLGVGTHYGEWVGNGIQRNYGLSKKYFFLFNVGRWSPMGEPGKTRVPDCCRVVPTIYEGPFDTQVVDRVVAHLSRVGSVAVPGFMDPEGIMCYHKASGQIFKITCKNDGVPKSVAENRIDDFIASRANLQDQV